jgi:hypothetical protein
MTIEIVDKIRPDLSYFSMALYGSIDAAKNAVKSLKEKNDIKAKFGRCKVGSGFAYCIYTTFKTTADEAFFILRVSDGIEI